MSVDRDHVMLSPRELRALARMESEAAASDPELENRMVAGRPRRWLGWRPSARVALGLLAAGMAVVVATLELSAWLAFTGVVMMGVALRWLVTSLGSRLPRSWRERRPGRRR